MTAIRRAVSDKDPTRSGLAYFRPLRITGMRSKAFLIRSLPPTLPWDAPRKRLLFGSSEIDGSDEEQLQCFSRVLSQLEGAELFPDQTFNALCEILPFNWSKTNQFGDDQSTLWRFDIDNGTLEYLTADRSGRFRIHLGRLRSRPVSLADFEYVGPVYPPRLDPTILSSGPYWSPDSKVDERTRAFTHRILCDFNHQWKNSLQFPCNTLSLRVFARALIRLATLDYDVREETGSRQGQGRYYLRTLVKWKPFEADIVRVRGVYVVICHSVQEGMSMAREHAHSAPQASTSEERPNYMILSLKHIMLCHAGPNLFKHTAAARLLNGNRQCREPHLEPSIQAMDYLVWATAAGFPTTRLHTLPCEIQNLILRHATIGAVAAARLGCILGLGSPCLWKDGSLNMELEETKMSRTDSCPLESQLWFQEDKVGVVYRSRLRAHLYSDWYIL